MTPVKRWLFVLELLARLLVGGIFVYAAVGKLLAPIEEFEASIRTYGFLSDGLIRPFALITPWVELLAGFFVLLGFWRRWAAAVLSLMLLSFIIAITTNIIRGNLDIDCGCFGTFSIGSSPYEALWKDIVLFALSLFLLFRKRWKWSVDGIFASDKADS